MTDFSGEVLRPEQQMVLMENLRVALNSNLAPLYNAENKFWMQCIRGTVKEALEAEDETTTQEWLEHGESVATMNAAEATFAFILTDSRTAILNDNRTEVIAWEPTGVEKLWITKVNPLTGEELPGARHGEIARIAGEAIIEPYSPHMPGFRDLTEHDIQLAIERLVDQKKHGLVYAAHPEVMDVAVETSAYIPGY